jgi:hypothetical protein
MAFWAQYGRGRMIKSKLLFSSNTMKICYECGRVSSGEPLFCNSCGRSYDVKLCPRLHPNGRNADVCSQCGSRDLSTPQPRVSLWWRVMESLLKFLIGFLLVCLSLLFAIALLKGLLSQPQMLNGLIALGVLLAILWWLWSPEWFRKFVWHLIRRKKQEEE